MGFPVRASAKQPRLPALLPQILGLAPRPRRVGAVPSCDVATMRRAISERREGDGAGCARPISPFREARAPERECNERQ